MKRIIIAAIITIALNALNASAQEKTTYIIDGQKVEHFDGSQLSGKLITSYTVDAKTNTHTISTYKRSVQKDGDKIRIVGSGKVSDLNQAQTFRFKGGDDEVVCVVDGKVVPQAEVQTMDASTISEVEVIKNQDSPIFKKYAKEGTLGVILFTTIND